jgi:hypothetical protein
VGEGMGEEGRVEEWSLQTMQVSFRGIFFMHFVLHNIM